MASIFYNQYLRPGKTVARFHIRETLNRSLLLLLLKTVALGSFCSQLSANIHEVD